MAIPTLQRVLEEHWPSYAKKHRSRLNRAHYRAVRCALACRTAEMGGKLYRCGSCSKYHYAYHSCNHRNCPQCGALERQAWSAKQEAKLLPAAYFMVTFTLPDKLRYLCLAFPRILYKLMLTESAAALRDVIATKYKSGRIGHLSVLHTWGRQMQHHPHVHCIVPAVVFDEANLQLKLPKKDDFLVHYGPLAARFRSRIYFRLKDDYPEIYSQLTPAARDVLRPKIQWNVDLQHVGKGATALRYLARYVNSGPFSPKRMIGYDKTGHLLLKWTCSDTGITKVMRLSPHEFIRRWLLHVLPKGFQRCRHYGYLSGAAKKTRLKVRLLLGEFAEPAPAEPEAESALRCPHCDGELIYISKIPRIQCGLPRGPPFPKLVNTND